jgi:hypothetical protein
MGGKGKGKGPSKSKGKTEVLEATTPHGDSDATLSSHGNQVRIFDLFLAAATITDAALKAKAGTTFANMPEEVACSQPIYAYFCSYLIYAYIIDQGKKNSGQHLDYTSAKAIWSGIINQSHVKWSAPGAISDINLLVRASPASAARPFHQSSSLAACSDWMRFRSGRSSSTASRKGTTC